MNKCKSCDAALVEKAKFCIKCGYKLPEDKLADQADLTPNDSNIGDKPEADAAEPIAVEEPDIPPAKYVPLSVLEVIDLRFFESGSVPTHREEWVFAERFSKEQVRFINWEIGLKHPPENEDRYFELAYFYYGPNDEEKVITSGVDKFMIKASRTESYHNLGCGWDAPGNWEPGIYYVDIILDNRVIGRGGFEIY